MHPHHICLGECTECQWPSQQRTLCDGVAKRRCHGIRLTPVTQKQGKGRWVGLSRPCVPSVPPVMLVVIIATECRVTDLGKFRPTARPTVYAGQLFRLTNSYTGNIGYVIDNRCYHWLVWPDYQSRDHGLIPNCWRLWVLKCTSHSNVTFYIDYVGRSVWYAVYSVGKGYVVWWCVVVAYDNKLYNSNIIHY